MTPQPNSILGTHEVTNQPPAPGDRNLWQDDPVARQILRGSAAQDEALGRYGAQMGRAEMQAAARDANRHLPELRLFDTGGRRLDEVAFHPAYHRFLEISVGAGYAALPWEGAQNAHAQHACMVYMANQVEPGHSCPLAMTYAAVPVIRRAEGLDPHWAAGLVSHEYDPSVRPAAQKRGLTLGMAMTEKQGGSDVRANTTMAVPDGAAWRLTGHKWFCSAPMSDGFLTLAQTSEGLTCFLVPRWLDGARNGIRLQRLKDKLGNRSNASSEIEYVDALAYAVGAPGDGVRTIVEMVHHTRLDTAMAPAGLMRAALREAHHWVTHRSVFQKRLIDQPLMQAVLADLSLDWAGSLALGLDVARHFGSDRPEDQAFARIGVAVAKYLANKLCPLVTVEAMEVMGGMGYIEDTPMPMLYREAPLNGIWEGSGNVICLDALRSLHRDPAAADALRNRLDGAMGLDATFDAALADYRARWDKGVAEAEARWFVEQTGLLLSAAALMRSAPATVAEAFTATRLGASRGLTRGAIAQGSARHVLDHCFAEGAHG
ncbi:DNA alkylation response protein [Aliishimia ponticola]|uniref:DNA alkylation response protein n=1 Tax=Aliishimia ponticola TaxID=2499833 RepID=A0A4S4N9F1_9RHOB|nr:acyl-CoA dehydrogenase family protein [Aliishimia ponticola]THH35874.1 DNA alkylation response protein [Aliishimia ponticola]